MTTSQPVAPKEDPISKLLMEIILRLVDDEQSVRVTCVEKEGLTTLNVHVRHRTQASS